MQNTLTIEDKNYFKGVFVKRLNRFLVTIRIKKSFKQSMGKKEAGKEIFAHLPSSGRMTELLVKGADVIIRPATNKNRKTAYDLIKVKHGRHWVSVDARIPNVIVRRHLQHRDQDFIRALPPYETYSSEITHGKSRFDFALRTKERIIWIEVKSITLAEKGRALFPDAVTERGTRHMLHLAELKRRGQDAVAIFIAQRQDVEVFSPHAKKDERFANAVSVAANEGVKILAFNCIVSPSSIRLNQQIDVEL